jgi:cysteine-rich repeat protein
MCTETEECIDNKCICMASCDDIECGTNACGEVCGTCLEGQSCIDGKCKDGDCSGGCDDSHPCTVDTCHPELGCTFQWKEPCCGNFILEEGEDCDDGNTTNDDGCSDECVKDPYVQYVGVTEWTQNCGVHDDAKQDELMHETCQEEYGDSARAATGIEVVNDWVAEPGQTLTYFLFIFSSLLSMGSGTVTFHFLADGF